LITRIKPHYAIHLGDNQSIEVDNATKLHSLQTAVSQYRGTMHEIAAYNPASTPMRTDAELRAMQMESYFHLAKQKLRNPSTSAWLPGPVSQLVPWELCYEETEDRLQDFVSFAMYSEPIEPASLIHALNGSVIQIVESTSSVIPNSYTAVPRTSKHRVPYFPESDRTGMVEPLDPKTSKLICTALIRGFDLERRIVQLLVPQAHDDALYGLTPERTVLVGGCCDPPEWAYLEDVYAARSTLRQSEETQCIPWVEKKERVEDMGYLNTVRRVRKFQT
jgi:polynucleotide 5'-hydroxyl-kinase GRC3/NOL9